MDQSDATSRTGAVAGGRRGQASLALVDRALVQHPWLTQLLLYPLSLAAGFILARTGLSTWDTVAHADHGRWLLGMWRGEDFPLRYETLVWIGPLWEYVLAVFSALFGFLEDPLWVRHAATFSFLPPTLVATYQLLRRAGETPGTAFLAVALIVGNVRFVGHAVLNVKDFPFAAGYLVVTLLMWIVLHEKVTAPARLLQRPGWLATLALLSVVPYLLRVPALGHWLLLVGICLWAALFDAGAAGPRRRWGAVLIPLVLGPLVVFVASPGVWDLGPAAFVHTTTLFSRFPWEGPVRLFGRSFLSTELPWWYALAWVPVSWVPIGLVAVALGGILAVPRIVRAVRRERPWPLRPLFGSFTFWVALFAAIPWVAFLVLQPVLYDEDRHVLFGMPLLAVVAALGMRDLPGRLKGVLALCVLASAVWSAATWTRYAYVYKNPLLPRSSGDDFMGDYWAASTGALAQALYDHVPDRSYVYTIGPRDALIREIERRERSLVMRVPDSRSFDLRQRARRRGQMYVAATNRNGACRPLLEDVARGRAQELWREEMPGGGVAALLVYYPGRCDDCPERLRKNSRVGAD